MSSSNTIVLATRNEGKVREIQALPAADGLKLTPLAEYGDPAEVEENGLTFEENAVLKAVQYSLWITRTSGLNIPVIAEDSGLEVEALLGWPGIQSARVASTTEARNLLLLEKLKEHDRRQARFVAATALAVNGFLIETARGEVAGEITEKLSGTDGFGYDPVFFCPELGKTFAEADREEKNRVSHRTKAWSAILEAAKQQQKVLH